jgi:hypothetical protein
MKETFPANTVLGTYISTENMLIDAMRIIPYCDEHEDVWSPVFITILLEVCSQLDSLWKYQAQLSPCVTKNRLTIQDYFEYFGKYLASKWVVFYGEEPQKIHPYESWSQVDEFKRNNYPNAEWWWSAYNKVKHDRLRNRAEATLKHAVNSLGGLFLAILRVELCRDAVAQAGWLIGDGYNLQAWLGEDSPSVKSKFITVETKLFTYPVGWGNESINQSINWGKWGGTCSRRFSDWLDKYTSMA